MTTIRDELERVILSSWGGNQAPAPVCEALDIDPDLPAEWATEERCRRWLDEHGGCSIHGPLYDPTGQRSGAYYGEYYGEYNQQIEARTEHAVLIAACQAVQEQS